jgi:glycosyltransferase involved in cell wall biosynthesis
MRIAIIAEVFLPKIDGVVHRTLNLIRQLLTSGDELLVVCPDANGCNAGPTPTLAVRSFPFPPYPEYRVGLPDDRLAKRILQFAPDVIHYVNPFAFGFRCCDALERGGVQAPSVFSFHTLYGEFAKRYRYLKPLSQLLWWLMRDYHNRADINVTVSSAMQQELAERGFERVRCWPPAIDSNLFHPRQADSTMRARLLNGALSRPLLVTVSRLAPEKNVGWLAEVLDCLPDAHLAIVGDGPERQALEQRFAGKSVSFVGYLKGKDLAAAYASADAFLYASEMETMGNVVVEAMACGCAVVAPRAGGIPSLVRHGDDGLLFAPRNLEDAVGYTRRLLDDTKYRTQMSHAARKAVEDWTWSKSIQQVRGFYQEAIEQHRPGRRPATWSNRFAKASMDSLVSAFQCLASLSPAHERNRAAVLTAAGA